MVYQNFWFNIGYPGAKYKKMEVFRIRIHDFTLKKERKDTV